MAKATLNRKGSQEVVAAVSPLLATFYQLAGQGHVYRYLSGLAGSDMFNEQLAKVGTIKTEEDLYRMVSELPPKAELETLIKAEIVSEYAKINEHVQEIEAQRVEALKDPKVNYKGFWEELKTDIGTRFRIETETKNIRTKEQFDEHKEALAVSVAETLEQRLTDKTGNGFKLGDSLRVTKALGFNVVDDTETYYHGGDVDDIPIGKTGELVEVSSADRLTIRFSAGKTDVYWHMHPTEVDNTGKNVYAQLLSKGGGDYKKAADLAIRKVAGDVKRKYLARARKKVNKLFDQKVQQASSELADRFKLDALQLKPLAAGDDFTYELRLGDEGIVLEPLFNHLAAFLRFTMNYKFEKGVLQIDERVGDLDGFLKYVKGAMSKVARKPKIPSMLEQVVAIADTLLQRQFQSTARLRDVWPEDRLLRTLQHLTSRNNEVGVRRRMLYNDPAIFIAEPFSPPSETHDHVVIAQAEYGCTHRCTYCTGYGQKLTIRNIKEFEAHAREVKRKLGDDYRYIRRGFLAGGNVFRHKADELLEYVRVMKRVFSRHLSRIAAFTRTEGLKNKSERELNRLEDAGLTTVYWGVESGSDGVLEYCRKKSSYKEMIEAAEKVRGSYLDASVMIMPGLGGLKYYAEHAQRTAEIVNAIKPKYLTFLTVSHNPGSDYSIRMAEEQLADENMPLTDAMVVEQMYDMVSLMTTGHSSLVASYLPPNDKVGSNPVQFTGRWQFGAKSDILHSLANYFNDQRQPSMLIPDTDFNRDSKIRKMVRQ